MSETYEKASSGYYKTKLPYGTERGTPERNAYHTDVQRLNAQFKADLFAEFGVTQNPKAELCFSKAWGLGHAYGHAEVASHFEDLVELIL